MDLVIIYSVSSFWSLWEGVTEHSPLPTKNSGLNKINLMVCLVIYFHTNISSSVEIVAS